MKALTDNSRTARVLGWLARSVCRRPGLFFYPQIILFVLSVWIALPEPYGWLKFNTSRNELVGSDKKYHQTFLQFKREFPQQDDLVVVAESEDSEKNRQFIERLGAKLEAETNLFTDVFYKG